MSFKWSNLIYWILILWFTCNSVTTELPTKVTEVVAPTNNNTSVTTELPTKVTKVVAPTNNNTSASNTTSTSVSSTNKTDIQSTPSTSVNTSSNTTSTSVSSTNKTDIQSTPSTSVNTSLPTTSAKASSTNATDPPATTIIPTTSLPTTSAKASSTNATDPPATTIIPTTSVSSKLQKLKLKEHVTARSVKVEWQRVIPLNKNDTFQLFVNIIIDNGTNTQTFSINQSSAAFSGEHTIYYLRPYSNYTLTTYEKFGNETGPESKLTITTKEAAPSKPQQLQIVTRSEYYIDIKWDEPAMLNGKVVEFMINHTFDGNPVNMFSVQLPANQRNYRINHLYAFVNYIIYVQEKTVAYSPSASSSAITLQAAPYAPPHPILVDKGYLLPKGEGNYKVEVKISWNPIPFYHRGDDYVSYRVHIIKMSGVENETEIINTTYIKPILEVYSSYEVKIYTTNTVGISDNASIWKFNTTQAPPSKPRDLQLTALRSDNFRYHTINVSWTAPEYLNGIPSRFSYTVRKECSLTRCKRQDLEHTGVIDFHSPPRRSHHIIQRLHAYSRYVIAITERTCMGCWGDKSDDASVTTFAGVPTKPRDVERSFDSSSVDISWKPPENPNGKIIHYRVILRREVSSDVEKNVTIGNKIYNQRFEDLESETGYTIEILAINEGSNGGIIGDPAATTFQTSRSRIWLFILIGCLVVVLIVVLILSVYLLMSRRRRQYKEVKTNDDIEMRSATRTKVIPVATFKNYCAQHHANSDHGFQQEYETLRPPVRQFTWEFSAMPCNQVKNRYSNIVAYDHSRVILTAIDDDPSSTYINANYIDGYLREKQYIATQGPLPETIIDFWRMIWDENCPIIVMLTKLVEDNRLKCEQYWPEGKGMQYRDIVVTIVSVKEMTDMTVMLFKLNKINNPELGTREVRHFHYTAWPDHGVPGHPTSMLSFIRHVMSYFPKEITAPIVVHCSAGVGRTGTFIAIEGCLRQMENDDQVDVFGTVLRMRMQRNIMVQTEGQYTFIYDALLDHAVCGNTEISPENLVTRIKYLNEQDAESGQTHFVAEFKRLESGFSLKDKEQFTDASQPENKAKNRFLNILPFDKNRIRLTPIAGSRQSDYINASIIDGFQQKHAFIATQAPLENTVVDFWRMVLEQNVRIIVMLTKTEEKGQEKSHLYWPQAGTVSYGDVHVELVNVRNQDDIYIIHDLRLTNRETGKSWPVTHFLYLGWPEYHGSPDSGTDLMHFIGLVEKTQRTIEGGGPTLVHCSGGVGRTGVFITVFNSVERLKAKNIVDVFQTTRALRLQRSAMVQTIDQYKFCYQCLKDYLDSFDLYANPEC